MSGQNPREIALQVLQHRGGKLFIEDLLDAELQRVKLAGPDRRLCQELVYGIVRWQTPLDWLIARKTDPNRPQKTLTQNLLRLGLYQIFFLDRIPSHAAVHETVEIAKRRGLASAAGFLNAVLRGFIREFDGTKAALSDLKISQPALGYSHPEWLVQRWQHRFGPEKTAQLMAWNNTPPKTFARVNTLKANPGKLVEQWREEEVDYDFVRRDWLPENLVFELKSHPPLESLASFRSGLFYLQDPSTLLAVRELGPHPGEAILDLCAAPGGKLTYAAQLMNNEGRLIAHDLNETRLKLIQDNCRRLGITCVEPVLPSAFTGSQPAGRMPARFDRVLVDAPCSNTGVMRRRVELRWRIRPEEIERLHNTQLDLLRLAAEHLKPGGILVYSTCSLEPEENEAVVKEFTSAHPAFRWDGSRELIPFADQVDGAYVARFTNEV